MGLTFGLNGTHVTGDGTARVIITGDIVDADDNRIADLAETICKAVEVWERLLDTMKA